MLQSNYLLGNLINRGENLEIQFENQKVQKIMTDMKCLTSKIGLAMAKTVKPETLGSEKIIIKGVLDYHGDKNEWIIP